MVRVSQLLAVPSGASLLSSYGPALLALLAAAVVVAVCRGKARQSWLRPGLALVLLLGWAVPELPGRLWAATVSPPLGPALLILPAAAVAGIELLRRWRAGRNDRLLSLASAGVVGWWLARTAAGPAELWRVGIVSAAVVGLFAAAVRQRAGRALAATLALWGGLAALGGMGGWVSAAAVAVACCIGPAALRLPAAVPSALLVALLAGVSLARGRLLRGQIDAVDLVCLFALAAPVLAGLAEPWLGKRWRPLAPAIAAAAAVGLSWGVRRAVGL